MYDSAMIMVTRKYVYYSIIILVLGVFAFLVTRKAKKWFFFIGLICFVLAVILVAVRITPVLIDYKKESYIVENNAKVICKDPGISFSDFGNSSLTIVTDDGRRIRLWYSGTFDKGQFQGIVVYAKRSKIVVFCDLEPIID